MIKLENLVCAIRKSPSSLKYHLTHSLESSSWRRFKTAATSWMTFMAFFIVRLIIVMQCSFFSEFIREKPYFRELFSQCHHFFADDAFKEENLLQIFFILKIESLGHKKLRKSNKNYLNLIFRLEVRQFFVVTVSGI